MSTEQKWRITWAAWVGAFVVAETIAIRSKHEHAPFSHHVRKVMGAGKSPLGQMVMLSASSWLYRHIFQEIPPVTNEPEDLNRHV